MYVLWSNFEGHSSAGTSLVDLTGALCFHSFQVMAAKIFAIGHWFQILTEICCEQLCNVVYELLRIYYHLRHPWNECFTLNYNSDIAQIKF